MGLAHLGPALSWQPSGSGPPPEVPTSPEACPCLSSFPYRARLQEPGLRATWAGCQCRGLTGRRMASSRKPSAVPRPACRAGRPACLQHEGWSQELRTLLSQSLAGPGPRAFSGAEGLSLGHTFPCWPWLSLPRSVSPPARHQLFRGRVYALGKAVHLTCFPENRMVGQADSASTLVGNRAVDLSSGFSCPYSLGARLGGSPKLPWLTWVRNNLSSTHSQAEARALSSWSWGEGKAKPRL